MDNFLNVAEFEQSIILSAIVSSAFLIGSVVPMFIKYSSRVKANISSFASGMFFSAIAFSLVDNSIKIGNIPDMAIGFVIGTVLFGMANHWLERRYGLDTGSNNNGSTTNIPLWPNRRNGAAAKESPAEIVIIGTFLDSIPENIYIGIIIALNLPGLAAAVIVLFLGNLAATLEGAKRMVDGGIAKSAIFKKWIYVFAIIAAAGPAGYYLQKILSNDQIAIVLGFASGALMAFITEELIPQAFAKYQFHIGIAATAGFLLGFLIFHYI
jgi:zinc transporter, ZIP family